MVKQISLIIYFLLLFSSPVFAENNLDVLKERREKLAMTEQYLKAEIEKAQLVFELLNIKIKEVRVQAQEVEKEIKNETDQGEKVKP